VYQVNYVPPRDLDDNQIKALILNYLVRRKCWNNKYLPRQKLVRFLGHDVLGDGGKVGDCIEDLRKLGWVNYMKKGETVSLNSRYLKDIFQHLDKYL